MTKKKTPRKTAAGAKAAKKKISNQSNTARNRADNRKKTSSAKTSNTRKSASVKKSSSSQSSTNKKKATAKSSTTKKKKASPAKKAAAPKKAVHATKTKKASPKKSSAKKTPETKAKQGQAVKALQTKKASGDKSGPGRGTAAKPRPIAFSLEEARQIAQTRPKTADESPRKRTSGDSAPAGKQGSAPQEPKPAARVLGAASLADILGRSPDTSSNPIESQKKEIPKKHQRYFVLLQELREHVLSELDLHTKDTLKRSSKEDSGNLSGYGQHMADAGTDSFDRDFALSLVSTEQEALSEIEAAIGRIHKGTYGVCEITGKPISKERLLAVPFARYSIEGQVEYEKTQRRPSQRGGAYLDSTSDSGEFLTEDPDD